MGLAFFSAASTLVAVPTSVMIFSWIGTLWKGRVRLELPMLWILGFFATFVIGGLTGVMLAVVPFNWQVHDTHFVVAHLHYVLIGGYVFPMIAAIYYFHAAAHRADAVLQAGRGGVLAGGAVRSTSPSLRCTWRDFWVSAGGPGPMTRVRDGTC